MKHRTFRTFTVLLIALGVASCRPPSLYMVEPAGPKEYKLGWEDGCDTGVSSVSAGIFKSAFGFRKRPEFLDNQLYNTGWNEGFGYCRFAMDDVNKGSIFK